VGVRVVSDDPGASDTVKSLIRKRQAMQQVQQAAQGVGGDGGGGGGGGAGVEPAAPAAAGSARQQPQLPSSRSAHLVRDFEGVDIGWLTASAILDLWALSRANAQILTLSSNYARLAYELYIAYWDNPREYSRVANSKQHGGRRAARRGGNVDEEQLCAWPVVSLDVLWHDPH
jgi:hypothetical protein